MSQNPSQPDVPVICATRRGAVVLCLLSIVLGLTGCGPKNFINDNDKLREENLRLKQQVEALEEKIELHQGEIDSLRARTAGERAIKEADPPVLAKIEYSAYSGAVDQDNDGKDDLIRMYLTPRDHLGRLLPVAGRLKVQAVAIQDDAPPALLASRTYDPSEFDDAYRANLTGYHYTIELPLPESIDPAITSVTVKTSLTEAVTGHTLSAEEIVELKTK